jgi:hypothetical protein
MSSDTTQTTKSKQVRYTDGSYSRKMEEQPQTTKGKRMKKNALTISKSLLSKLLMEMYLAGCGNQNHRTELKRALNRAQKASDR